MTRVVADADVVSYVFKNHPFGSRFDRELTGRVEPKSCRRVTTSPRALRGPHSFGGQASHCLLEEFHKTRPRGSPGRSTWCDTALVPAASLTPIGYVKSSLRERKNAPRQGHDGAPGATIELQPGFAEALEGVSAGDSLWILTWLHQAERSTLQVRPGGNPATPLTGVFATRSPDRPNPIGLHRAKVLRVEPLRLVIEHLEAIDGTPVLDLKPVLPREQSDR